MPSRQRYLKYRTDQTTIWVSKKAHEFLLKNRDAAREAVSDVLDRLLKELRGTRKGSEAKGGARKTAAKKAAPRKKAAKRVAKRR